MAGRRAFDCPNPEVASGERTYSLRKPWQTSSSIYFLEALTVDGLIPFTVVVGSVPFCSKKCRIVLNCFWTSDPCLVLDSIEDLVDEEPKRSEMLCQLEGLE